MVDDLQGRFRTLADRFAEPTTRPSPPPAPSAVVFVLTRLKAFRTRRQAPAVPKVTVLVFDPSCKSLARVPVHEMIEYFKGRNGYYQWHRTAELWVVLGVSLGAAVLGSVLFNILLILFVPGAALAGVGLGWLVLLGPLAAIGGWKLGQRTLADKALWVVRRTDGVLTPVVAEEVLEAIQTGGRGIVGADTLGDITQQWATRAWLRINSGQFQRMDLASIVMLLIASFVALVLVGAIYAEPNTGTVVVTEATNGTSGN